MDTFKSGFFYRRSRCCRGTSRPECLGMTGITSQQENDVPDWGPFPTECLFRGRYFRVHKSINKVVINNKETYKFLDPFVLELLKDVPESASHFSMSRNILFIFDGNL
jgi:hypothetical protein